MPSLVSHLEMLSREEFSPGEVPPGFELRKETTLDGLVNKEMYRQVGSQWDWTDRLKWSDRQWAEYVGRDGIETWLGYWKGELAGYFELKREAEGSVEIVYFGLLPAMIGRGLGSAMLSLAVAGAWAGQETRRVWLHTCTEDHPHALANYLKRGFRLFKTIEE